MSTSQVQVAILSSDLLWAQEASRILRKMGTVPAVFQHSKDFLEACQGLRPDLAIVDLATMNKGKNPLSNSTPLKEGHFPCIWALDEGQGPLLRSVSSFWGMGTLIKNGPWQEGLRTLARSYNRFSKAIGEKEKLEHLNKGLLADLEKAQDLLDNERNQQRSWSEVLEAVQKLKTLPLEQGMGRLFAETLLPLSAIDEGVIFEKSVQGNQLIGKRIKGEAVEESPIIWTSSPQHKGLGREAVLMADSFIQGSYGEKWIRLEVRKSNQRPDILVYLKLKGPEHSHAQWSLLEDSLNQAYRKQDHATSVETGIMGTSKALELPPWKILSHIEKAGLNAGLLLLEVGKFQDLCREEDVDWNRLFHDLKGLWERSLPPQAVWGQWSSSEFIFFCTDEDLTKIIDRWRSRLSKFPFWRYVSEGGMAKALTFGESIKLRALPVTSESLLTLGQTKQPKGPSYEASL